MEKQRRSRPVGSIYRNLYERLDEPLILEREVRQDPREIAKASCIKRIPTGILKSNQRGLVKILIAIGLQDWFT